MLLILALLSFLSWMYLLFLRGDFWRSDPQLPPAGSLERWPPVAAIVPARDESAVIERTLFSLRRHDYPGSYFAAALGGAAWILMFSAYRPMIRFYRQPDWSALLLPAAAFLYMMRGRGKRGLHSHPFVP